MSATPYLPARLPATRRPGGPPLPPHRLSSDGAAHDAVTLTGTAPASARDPGRSRDPAGPRHRLQKATWSYTGSGTVSPVVSSTCVSSVTT